MTTREQVCTTLLSILSDGIDIHRCAAAAALGRIAEPDTVGALTSALLDEDEDVRSDAAEALAGMDDPRTIDQLMENLLGDPSSVVKLAAMKTLTRLHHEDLVPWLRRIISGRDEEIAWDDDEYYAGGWDDWLDLQIQAIDAVATLGAEEAVPDIVAALGDEMGQDISEAAFRALARLGESGVAELATIMESDDSRVRRRAVVQLAECPSPAAADAVAKGLKDREVEVRVAAVKSLAQRNPADRRLLPLLSDPSAEVREEVVRLCGNEHRERLEALLDDKAHRVQRAVLGLIAASPEYFRGVGMEATVRSRLQGDAPKTAAAAARALAALAPETAFEDLSEQVADTKRMEDIRLGALKAIVGLKDERVEEFLSGLVGDGNRQVRLETMAGLVRRAAMTTWPNRAGDILLAALRGELVLAPESGSAPEPQVAEARQEEFSETVSKELEPDAEAQPGDDQVSQSAVAEAGPSSTLSAILGENSPHLQVVKKEGSKVELSPTDLEFLGLAERKLRKRKVSAAPQVAPHQDVRRFSARLLGDLAFEAVAVELAAQLIPDQDPEVRNNAADSLARIANGLMTFPASVQEALVALLDGNERDLRVLAVRALGLAGDDHATPILSACLTDSDNFVRCEAVRALAKRSESDREILFNLLSDPDSSVRLAAAQALATDGTNGTIDRLAEFAFAFEGYHHREVAGMLRDLDPSAASERFLGVLSAEERKREWEIAITALGELNGTKRAYA